MKNIQAILESERKQLDAYLSYKATRPTRRARKDKVRLSSSSSKQKYPRSKYAVYSLYVLLLTGDNYYIGITRYKDPYKRFREHLDINDKRGAKWTKFHKPIDVIEIRSLGFMTLGEAARHENKVTVEYIDQFGIEKVRGGDMCQIDYIKNVKNYMRHSHKPEYRKVYLPERIKQIMVEEY